MLTTSYNTGFPTSATVGRRRLLGRGRLGSSFLPQQQLAAQSYVPPLRGRAVFNEAGYVSKPINRKYIFKPTLWTRVKNLLFRGNSTMMGTTGLPMQSGISSGLGYQTGGMGYRSGGIAAGNIVPPLRSKARFSDVGYVAKPVHRNYVFKPTLWTRFKNVVTPRPYAW